MANKELSIILRAIGAVQAAADIGKVNTSVRNLGANVRGIAKGAKSSILQGVGLGIGQAAYNTFNQAVGASIDFLTGSIQAAADEEAGIASLTAALKANIKGWNGDTKAIEDHVSAGAKLSFSDDEMRASLAILVGATKDVGKAFDIQSVAMDLARYKHISLTDASEALIRVESGQYRMLKSLGIQLPKNATAQQALAAVEAQAAGQAQAYADTTQGAFDQLGIATHNLQEDIGKGLAPAAEDLAKGIQYYAIPAVHGLMDVLGGLGDVASNILGALQVIPAAIGAIADAARFAASPLGNLNDALGGLGDVINGTGGRNQTPAPTKYGLPPTSPSLSPVQQSQNVRGRAAGGPVEAGRAYVVGEHHPELFVPSSNGSIVPSLGGVTVNVQVMPPSVTASDVQKARVKRVSAGKAHGSAHSLIGATQYG